MAAQEHKPHLLRGETEEQHVWTLDRLASAAQGALTAGDLAVRAVGRALQVQVQGVLHQWELPVDTDLKAPATAQWDAAAGKLTLTFGKKPHGDSPEELQRLKMESMADNRSTNWWTIVEAACQ